VSDAFVLSTDLFPTFLDAASIALPTNMQLDGLSVLPQLIPRYHETRSTSSSGDADRVIFDRAVRDRVGLWHNDFEGNRSSAAWIYSYKVILDRNDTLCEMYDMVSDKSEQRNLLKSTSYDVGSSEHGYSVESILLDRTNASIHSHIAHQAYKLLIDYIRSGSMAYRDLMDQYPVWRYRPTALSYHRAHIYDQELIQMSGPFSDPSSNDVHRLVKETTTSCHAPVQGKSCCNCTSTSTDEYVLRFDLMETQYQYTTPKRLNASKLLFISA